MYWRIYGKKLLNIEDIYIQKSGIENEFGVVDFSSTASLFQLIESNSGNCRVREFSENTTTDNIKDISHQELDEYYIKLVDFINGATFIGREFKRTEPVYRRFMNCDRPIIDKSYMGVEDSIHDKNIILYKKDNICLVKHIGIYGETYGIIQHDYIQDDNYDFFGPVYIEYSDINMLLSLIFKQIEEWNKVFDNDKVRKRIMPN